ncbi:MAG TPA: ABC transporter substrate-binding protein [Candidatus Bathyarchaeia archaeon]|nr:ABC transporter substrate-binding protein [Candidatus Bathyarchaeia archaeon]
MRIWHLTTSYHTAFILMGTDWIERRIGVKPEWNLYPTGPEMMRAFAREELDVGYVGLPPAMIAIAKGIQLKCIAGGHMEGTVLTAKGNLKTFEETGGVKEVLDQLRGKIVGTPSRGSIHDVIIRTLLEEAGLGKAVPVRNFDWADLALYAMESGEVQAAVGTPPLAVLATQLLGAKMMLPPNVMWPHNPSYGIVATRNMIDDSAESLGAFVGLHEDACNLIRKDPRTAARMAAEATGIMNEEFILQVFKVSPKYCASLPLEYTNSTMAFVPALQRMGYIAKALKEHDVFHKRIIECIHKEPPHYEEPPKFG